MSERYVSRAALKLAGVADKFNLDFNAKTVLDIGSSTGGFTDFALRAGAKKVIAVELGTNQMAANLAVDPRVELHEKTDIRGFSPRQTPDLILVDVSFVSLRQILPTVAKLADQHTQIVALFKPQFEAARGDLNRGVVKNERIRRQLAVDFELWSRRQFVIKDKMDSQIAGAHGNKERLYLLQIRL